jgi:hypothetical protein
MFLDQIILLIERSLLRILIISCILIQVSCKKSFPPLLQELGKIECPRQYVVYKNIDTIIIDGKDNEASWQEASWSTSFVDITGENTEPQPLDTRFKMLWSEEYLYVLAKLTEPHIWATLTEKDAVIYHDDDFEIFIDADGDGHNYIEIEINAMNTVWDLFLTKPYRVVKQKKVLWRWNISGLHTATAIKGTLNDARDNDDFWMVEMAIPMPVLQEFAPGGTPNEGSLWRINFSRVDWPVEIKNNKYQKKKDKEGKILPERNWVWSPHGAVNMHMPERWGYLQFTGSKVGESIVDLAPDPDCSLKQLAYRYFQVLREKYWKIGRYPQNLEGAGLSRSTILGDFHYEPGKQRFELIFSSNKTGKIWVINEEGRLYTSPPSPAFD